MDSARYVVLFGQQGHPLASARGELLEHRAVLFGLLGPGTHPCHWCGQPVTWQKRDRGGSMAGHLHVDHLDGNGLNNSPANLVPSCQACNVSAGYRSDRIGPGEPVKVRPDGMRTRAREQTCPACGQSFLAEPSAKAVYCSRVCAASPRRLDDACGNGHPRTTESTYTYKGRRRCRVCQREVYKAYRRRKRGA